MLSLWGGCLLFCLMSNNCCVCCLFLWFVSLGVLLRLFCVCWLVWFGCLLFWLCVCLLLFYVRFALLFLFCVLLGLVSVLVVVAIRLFAVSFFSGGGMVFWVFLVVSVLVYN